ncbi:GNAT family N-acetyltransferase [Bradyrhizobium barranii]|uniref:GNAT family N-acetyltransferase n=1 Tax=Bradyrhizobium barranii TaxID=2992140 RepID=UPI0024B22EF1|nr:GNAT family N-acetyltransferase [Bradyrhizobium barranii]WFT96854.1 GNAT family N-acetyltransferase [Bradyrhizobium barranii]
MQFSISQTTLDKVLPRRYKLLRPDHIGADAPFEFKLTSADMSDISIHLIASATDRVIGILSAGPELCPFRRCENSWRLRGFAVDRSMRRQGIGAALLGTMILKAHQQGANAVWGNPRVIGALHTCMHFGFETVGEQYEIPPFGLHQNAIRHFTDDLISSLNATDVAA